jgi:hypothetical protein
MQLQAHLQELLWLFLPLLVAAGSALLAYVLMHARMEVAVAKERETLAETRAALQSHKITMEERIKATEESIRRSTLEEVMRDIRIEERSYVRDTHTAEGTRRSMVMQERIFFRNIPMSSWTEREMLIEQTGPNVAPKLHENRGLPELAPRPSLPKPVAPTPSDHPERHLTAVPAGWGIH